MDNAPKDKDETMEMLNRIGLPVTFHWKGKQVLPSYSITAYGKWLRETPYHRGLFQECHDTLVAHWVEIDTADELADAINRREALRKEEFFPGI